MRDFLMWCLFAVLFGMMAMYLAHTTSAETAALSGVVTLFADRAYRNWKNATRPTPRTDG